VYVIIWSSLRLFCSCFFRREVLPAAIKTLKDGGYRLVSVAECLGKEAYLKDAPPLLKVSRSALCLRRRLSDDGLMKSDLNCSWYYSWNNVEPSHDPTPIYVHPYSSVNVLQVFKFLHRNKSDQLWYTEIWAVKWWPHQDHTARISETASSVWASLTNNAREVGRGLVFKSYPAQSVLSQVSVSIKLDIHVYGRVALLVIT